MRPVGVELPTPRDAVPEEMPMAFAQEKPEWCVSYTWGDTTPECRERENVVDDLCAKAAAEGRLILRDKDVLKVGDSISAFEHRIGNAQRVFVILSDKYLKSPHCMYELRDIWRTSRQEGPAFLDRVRLFTLGDAAIWETIDRIRYAAYWKKRHDELEALVHENGLGILGTHGAADFERMGEFYRQVGDILATFADRVQPRTFDELVQHGFQE